MLVAGLIALITAIFLGGPGEIFYVDNLEKGIKKHVVEKERKKEILSELKSTKTYVKTFNKERKQDYKKFIELYNSRDTEGDDLNLFFDKLHAKRTPNQEKLIESRLSIFSKITDNEWQSIVSTSELASEKRILKAQKKAAKIKVLFPKTRSSIQKNVADINQQKKLIGNLDDFISSLAELEQTMKTVNVSENKVLANKDSSKKDLMEVFEEENKLRMASYTSLIAFHESIKANSSTDEWTPIMKAFTKELEMSSR